MSFERRSNIIDVYVRYLRGKIGRDAIDTVRGRGYRLRGPQ
jgi:DNA-binding response OmpR family regulator